MDYNNFNNNSDGNKYRATRNFNTALEDPQFAAGNTFDVNLAKGNEDLEEKKVDLVSNISDNVLVENNNYGLNNFSQQKEENSNDFYASKDTNSEFINNNITPVVVDNNNMVDNNTFVNSSINDSQPNNFNSDSFTEVPSNEVGNKVNYAPTSKKKKKKVSLAIPTELRILIILVIIILVFIYVIPNLYEFFRELRLSILGR